MSSMTFKDKVEAMYEWFLSQPEDRVPQREEFEALVRKLRDADDLLGLGAFVGKHVALQLKPGYQYNNVRSGGRGRTALLLFKQENGRLVAASERDTEAMPVAFAFIVGTLRQRDSGHYYVEMVDETLAGGRIEVALHPDAVMAVSTAVEPSSILIS